MSVKEIIIYVAKILGMNDIVKYLSNEDVDATEEVHEEMEKLLIAINMLNGVIASQFVEIKDVKYIENHSDIILYSSISKNQIIEIKKVLDNNNLPVDFKQTSLGIICNADKVNIEFSYFPSIVTIDECIDYYLGLDVLTFAQGVLGQYLFLKGDFEESYVWDKKFKHSLSSLVKTKRSIKMPNKRWL